jgi:site-specific DNA recombinase
VSPVLRAAIYLRVSSAQQVEKDLTEEGYSIPAQREACHRYLEQKGWDLAGEFTDAGESARSADRPALQEMLRAVHDDPTIKFVVVHKVDRIARNLEDHAGIRAALSKSGARLVSASEGIDDTASGRMVEGILASIAEYYSANLSNEIKKGMRQKIKMGGWPWPAPIGYLNKREAISGRNVASIVVDPDRAPLIQEGFERYATGQISVNRLASLMEAKGLRTPRYGKVVSGSRWLEIFRNPFYLGRVVYEGEEFEGAHEAIITPELFAKVETVIMLRNYAGTRDNRHFHHLKGTLRCGECGNLLSFSRSKGRHARYDYFYCLSKSRCSQPFIPTDEAEEVVEDLFEHVAMPKEPAAALLEALYETVAELRAGEDQERERLQRRVDKLEGDRLKLMQALYAEAISMDTLKKEQQRISVEIAKATRRLETLSTRLDEAQREIERALRLATVVAPRYRRYAPETRRKFNKAIFKAIYIRDKKIQHFEYSDALDPLIRTAGTIAAGGSNKDTLVERTGIEPVTPSLQSWCSPS